MYEKGDTLFQPTQSKSALKSFAIQHQVKGLNGYDIDSEESNLIYINIIFSLKHFMIYHIYDKWFKEIILQ